MIAADFCSDFINEAALKLSNEEGWSFCYYISSKENESFVHDNFKDTIFHDQSMAMRGIVPEECKNLDCPVLDHRLLDCFSVHETIVLRMMDRMDLGKWFSYQERLRHYHRLLKYWLGILNHFKPNAVLFSTIPHMVYDYILYILCHFKNIRTVIIERTAIPGLIYTLERFESKTASFVETYENLLSKYNGQDIILEQKTENYLMKLKGDYSEGIPFYLKKKLDTYGETVAGIDKNIFQKIFMKFVKYKKQTGTLIKYLSKYFFGTGSVSYYKEKNKAIEASAMTTNQYHLYNSLFASRRKKIAVHYRKTAKKVNLEKPYILVALHCQPEKSTSPMGGVYVNQYLMVEMLSTLIPEHWYIYVKEHVSQFKAYKSPERTKSELFYTDLAELKRVEIVDLSIPTFNLIDHAKATATVTSNAGWESVVRGKPAIIFGHAWYKSCEGVFYTPDYEQCQKVLSKIKNGYTVDEKKVRLFVKALEKACIRGYNHPSWALASGISFEENVTAIKSAIADWYYRKTVNNPA